MRIWLVVLVGVVALAMAVGADTRAPFRFMTLDPGHFHAALVQKEMYPGRLAAGRRLRAARPGPGRPPRPRRRLQPARDSRHELASSRSTPGPTTSSACCARSRATSSCSPAATRARSSASARSVDAGLHVLVDKPWILRPPTCRRSTPRWPRPTAQHVVAYDIMTERFEITSILQRALVNDPAVFGEQLPGTPAEPGVYMESVHHLMKVVSGAPNIRPAWFFDIDAAGRGPQRHRHAPGRSGAVDAVSRPGRRRRADVKVLSAYRWPTMIPEADFKRVTGSAGFPDAPDVAREERRARVLLQHARRPTRCAASTSRSTCPGTGKRRPAPATRTSPSTGHARHRGAADEGRQLPPEVYVVPERRRGRAGRSSPRCRRAWPRCRASGRASPWTSATARST